MRAKRVSFGSAAWPLAIAVVARLYRKLPVGQTFGKPRMCTSSSLVASIVIVLVSLADAGFVLAQKQDRGAALERHITIEAVGKINTNQPNGPDQKVSNCSRPTVEWKEAIRGKATVDSGNFRGLSLQVLVREADADSNTAEHDWRVQPALLYPVTPEWKMDVQFGSTSDEGKAFDLQVIATRDPLPEGPVPQGMVDGEARVKSTTVRVRRRAASDVWISHIAGEAIRGDDVHNVSTISAVEVASAHLPSEAVVGVAVEPVSEDTTKMWVMNDVVSGGHGTITTHFGEPLQDNFKEYQVFAFAVCSDNFAELRTHQQPGDRYSMPLVEWQAFLDNLRKVDGFLVLSRPVRTKKWEESFQITMMNGSPVQSAGVKVPAVTDVEGTINRPLVPGEQLWVICSPNKGDPWVAGSTGKILPDGKWRVTGAELQKSGRPESFSVIALISGEIPDTKSPEKLRAWMNRAEQSDATAKVAVSNE